MEGLDSLLLNVLFLIVFLLFIPFLIENNGKFTSYDSYKKKWAITLTAGIAIISCISFRITIIEGYSFDLRLIALIIGGLYGGFKVGMILAIITVIYRFLVGGLGASASLIVMIFSLFLLFFAAKRFHQYSKIKKIMIGTALSAGITLFAICNSIFLFDVPLNGAFIVMYLTITIATTAAILYTYEWFQETILINQRVLKAEKLDVVSHLASSISHEVRNPLAVIKGFLQMMEQTELPQAKRREFIGICIEEINRANEIIRDYLTFAKPAPENFGLLDVSQELHRAINIITPLANMNSIEITTCIEPCYVEGDAQFFQQCLLNLTKNSIEAMPDSGKLSIQTKREKAELIIVISDTGKGMTQEQLSRIGEPYFTTKGREGTGLGMMAAMRIIDMMNGKLTVTSKVEEGTNFYIALPIVEVDTTEEKEELVG
ncbi:ATP-binding protein [Ammoniphilus sp. CFH 90114]|uniref:ATP-binding protein n=1 Tax=Ammoniphilus sp. CFH 90114 TaxID=2493665 RepID=UPI00100F2FF2|nr:ATP-binding protein [Ammoniphilus sp. CFH 90114]RXT02286.1 two-component sensor histidine kinase [Ammoniphilus sp. CFH 90114]